MRVFSAFMFSSNSSLVLLHFLMNTLHTHKHKRKSKFTDLELWYPRRETSHLQKSQLRSAHVLRWSYKIYWVLHIENYVKYTGCYTLRTMWNILGVTHWELCEIYWVLHILMSIRSFWKSNPTHFSEQRKEEETDNCCWGWHSMCFWLWASLLLRYQVVQVNMIFVEHI